MRDRGTGIGVGGRARGKGKANNEGAEMAEEGLRSRDSDEGTEEQGWGSRAAGATKGACRVVRKF